MPRTISKKIYALLCFVVLSFLSYSFIHAGNNVSKAATHSVTSATENMYSQLNLAATGLSFDAFKYGLEGYQQLKSQGKVANDSILTIIDFSLTSDKKRLFVLDVKNNTVLFNTYVSHGRNSGTDSAASFSNDMNSNKSSLGFYVTANTYSGKHGYSLRLNGEEAGFNDHALARGIVMHAAAYASEQTIQQLGFLGRSQGCPAIPQDIYKDVISRIQNGSCLFIFSPDENYLSHSPVLNHLRSNT